MKPVEFSQFFRLLNAVKEGQAEKRGEFESLLNSYEKSEGSENHLEQLGQMFLFIGITELYKYSGTDSLEEIGRIDKDGWEDIKEKSRAELPPHLANKMIIFAKEEGLSKELSKKWGVAKREVERNVMGMARYVTEGIIDAID